MKHLFKPNSLVLILFSAWMVWCCASLLEWSNDGNLVAHSYSIWGDWSAHFTFISNLLERGPHWLFGDNPVFSGVSFQYPFLSHVLTAAFAFVTRLSVPAACFVSSLLLLAALPFCLKRFYESLGLGKWTALAATLLFLLMGGFQFWDSNLDSQQPLTNQFDHASIVTQFVLFELFPQRAFLFGIIGLTLLGTAMIRKAVAEKFSRKDFLFFGVGLSLIAWTHVHCWIAAGAFMLVLYFLPPAPLKPKKILSFGLAVATVSFALLAALLLRDVSSPFRLSYDFWYPGWAQNAKANLPAASGMNPISFWLYNTGIFLPLVAVGCFFLFKRYEKRSTLPLEIKSSKKKAITAAVNPNAWLLPLTITGLILFIAGLCVNLQPYFYDTLKLFTCAFLFLAPAAAIALQELAFKKYLIPVAVLLLLFQSFTAIADFEFLRSGHQSSVFFSADEMALAEDFKGVRTSANALVMIAPRHNHWLPCLAGNPLVMGYPGWLWSWGINYSGREKMVNEVLTGAPNAMQSLESLHPDYVVVNSSEKAGNQPVNLVFLETHLKLVLQKKDWFVYSVKSPR